MKKLIFVFVLLFSVNFYAQINFEKGYFIDNNNVKTECLIRNQDWKSSPERFDYKISENEKSIEKNINEVKEFGVGEFDVYERFIGLVDDSSFNFAQTSDHKEPTWIKKTIFLKVIIQGKAKLYSYVNGNTSKYFYSNNGSPVEQLVYKKYAEDNVTIKVNNFFQQQLYTKVKCESVTLNEIFKVKYTDEDLSNYFLKVNNSSFDKKDLTEKKMDGTKNLDKRNKSKKDNFLLKAKAGIGFNSLNMDFTIKDQYGTESKTYPDFKFGGKQTFRVGFEMEYVLPTNSNKWSVFFDLEYQSNYEANKTIAVGSYPFNYEKHWNASYSSFDLGLGFRHYMFLNNNSKLFLSGLLKISPKSGAAVGSEKEQLIIISKPYVGLGLGYAYKRYNIEFRYSTRDILNDYYHIQSKYQDLSFVIGYTLFESNKK